MSGRRGTPLFSFEMLSRRSNSSNRLRAPTARELLDSIVPSAVGETLRGDTTRLTPPASNSASVGDDGNFECSPHREAQ